VLNKTGVSCTGHAKQSSEAELEEIVSQLRDGNVDARSSAAERLFNKAAEDENARQRTCSLGVVEPLVTPPPLPPSANSFSWVTMQGRRGRRGRVCNDGCWNAMTAAGMRDDS